MRTTDCDFCGSKDLPVNNTLKIDGKLYCEPCINRHFPYESSLEGKVVERELDPTICSSCHNDFGDTILKKISVYPICDACEKERKNKAFPLWVKAFFIAVLAIVITGFVWNWKYYQAYNSIKLSNRYADSSDYEKAYTYMQDASSKVPEVADLKVLTSFYHGIDLLAKDKSAEALEQLEQSKALPESFRVDYFIVQANIGKAFDTKEYESFVTYSKQQLAYDTAAAYSYAAVASAYACVYASKGNDSARQESLAYLQKAKMLDSSAEIKQYFNMIEYRIDSKRIIRREQFLKEFPNGWTKK
ncbi:MAG: hypothetical protein QM687_10355 [Ferruginibacter sp.]